MKEIGRLLKSERKRRLMSQTDLANALGVSLKTIWNAEEGIGGRVTMCKILDYFGMELTIKNKNNEEDNTETN